MLSAIVLPVLRGATEPAIREPLIRQTAKRFGVVANTVLLPTPVPVGSRWPGTAEYGWKAWTTGYGQLLGTKLVLVVVSIALAAVHGITATKRPRSARPLAIAGLASSIGIVIFATALVP